MDTQLISISLIMIVILLCLVIIISVSIQWHFINTEKRSRLSTEFDEKIWPLFNHFIKDGIDRLPELNHIYLPILREKLQDGLIYDNNPIQSNRIKQIAHHYLLNTIQNQLSSISRSSRADAIYEVYLYELDTLYTLVEEKTNSREAYINYLILLTKLDQGSFNQHIEKPNYKLSEAAYRWIFIHCDREVLNNQVDFTHNIPATRALLSFDEETIHA